MFFIGGKIIEILTKYENFTGYYFITNDKKEKY